MSAYLCRPMNHKLYMRRCIELAQNANGYTSPNPMVGSVVVHNEQIIGEGWHHAPGQPHAEVNAINSVKDKSKLKDSTIYVSLEPCAHFGRTPPCSDLIIENKIPRVVIGCRDPFEQVNGRGIEKLKAAGIEVIEGVLEEKCLELNKAFFTFHTKKRPYIILKWAQIADGFMDISRKENERGINWITQPETKTLVHQWRADVDAILVGKNTVLNDNPSLTVREVKGKNPIRLVMDRRNQLKDNFSIFNDEAETVVFTDKDTKPNEMKNHHTIDFSKNPLKQIMDYCYQNQIQSVLVEGGAHTLQSFIEAGLWDEARVLTGVGKFDDGLKGPQLHGFPISTKSFGKDVVKIYHP